MNVILTALVRRIHWHRRPLAMVLAVLAVVATVAATQEGRGSTVGVLVAVRTVPAGQVVATTDVELRQVPSSLAPQSALSRPDDAVGKVVTAGLSTGTVLTVYSVVTPRLAQAMGRVLAPVRLSDADIAHYLSPGDVIDVLTATEAQARTVARGAQVVALPAAKDGGRLGAGDSRGVLVILAVSPSEAQALAQAGSGGRLSVALT